MFASAMSHLWTTWNSPGILADECAARGRFLFLTELVGI
jgi:hypothetical protein